MAGYLVRLLLEEKVNEFNLHREKHPDVEIDLSGLDLSRKNLGGINFSGLDLREVICEGTQLCRSDLRKSRLPRKKHGACLAGSKLPEIDLSVESLRGVHLECASIEFFLAEGDVSLEEVVYALLKLQLTYSAIQMGFPIPSF
ncbi:MAG: pentapeptide repeat-containing protein [Minisyncoccia bacterium]